MVYSQRQVATLSLFSFAQFCNAMCISLQAPFYPKEAEAKGATSSQYGFVFGVYELVVFLLSPIYGRFLKELGPKLVNTTGILTVGAACGIFGALKYVRGPEPFIGLSLATRIVEAIGTSGFTTSSFSIIAREFPNNVGSSFALLETFFGLGLILGPTVGGGLYELGGFLLPFEAVSTMLIFAGLLIICLLPNDDDEHNITESTGSLFSLLRLSPIMVGCAIIFGTSFSIGFVQVTLEPHLRPLGLSPLQTGLMFVVNGAAYALSAPFWGSLCDHGLSPQIVSGFGTFFTAVAFLFMGPVPFLPIAKSVGLSAGALVIHGIGMGAGLVATFAWLQSTAVLRGFADDVGTYGLVSGLWTSSFALGAFIGPSTGGILSELFGFASSSILIFGMHCCLSMMTLFHYLCSRKPREESPLADADSMEGAEEIQQPLVSQRYRASYGSLTRAFPSASVDLIS